MKTKIYNILIGYLIVLLFAAVANGQEQATKPWSLVETEAKRAGEHRIQSEINLTGCWRIPVSSDNIFIHQQGSTIRTIRTLKDAGANEQALLFTGAWRAGEVKLQHHWSLERYLDYDYSANEQPQIKPVIQKMLEPVKNDMRAFYEFRVYTQPKDEIAGTTKTIALRGFFLLMNYWAHDPGKWDSSGGLIPKGWVPDWKLEKVPDDVGVSNYWFRQQTLDRDIVKVLMTDKDYKSPLTTIKPGERFWVRAHTNQGCKGAIDLVNVTVYPEGEEKKGISVTLVETGPDTLIFHSPAGGILVKEISDIRP